MFSPSQRIWDYETPDGSFAQFIRVQAQQLMPRLKHLIWEESACYTLTLATAYRLLLVIILMNSNPARMFWSGGLRESWAALPSN